MVSLCASEQAFAGSFLALDSRPRHHRHNISYAAIPPWERELLVSVSYPSGIVESRTLKRATPCGRYIQVLPQPSDSSLPEIPLLWNDEDFAWLQGTYLEEAVNSRKADLKRRWGEAIEVLNHAGWDTSCYTLLVTFSDAAILFHSLTLH